MRIIIKYLALKGRIPPAPKRSGLQISTSPQAKLDVRMAQTMAQTMDPKRPIELMALIKIYISHFQIETVSPRKCIRPDLRSGLPSSQSPTLTPHRADQTSDPFRSVKVHAMTDPAFSSHPDSLREPVPSQHSGAHDPH